MRLSTRLSESRDATRAIKLSWLTRSKSHDAVMAKALDQAIESIACRSGLIAESQSAVFAGEPRHELARRRSSCSDLP